MEKSNFILKLDSITWSKDACELIDYENGDLIPSNIETRRSGYILRNDNNVFYSEKVEDDCEKLLNIQCTENSFDIRPNPYTFDSTENITTLNTCWFSLKNYFYNNGDYKMNEGDIIKIGRITLRIKQIKNLNNKKEDKQKSPKSLVNISMNTNLNLKEIQTIKILKNNKVIDIKKNNKKIRSSHNMNGCISSRLSDNIINSKNKTENSNENKVKVGNGEIRDYENNECDFIETLGNNRLITNGNNVNEIEDDNMNTNKINNNDSKIMTLNNNHDDYNNGGTAYNEQNYQPNLDSYSKYTNLKSKIFNSKNISQKPKKHKVKICRICYMEEEENKLGDDNSQNEYDIKDSNPLVQPCNCSGTMKYIHLQCLKHWINTRTCIKVDSNENCSIFLIKQVECELCKTRLPDYIRHNNKLYEILDFQNEFKSYISLESLTLDKHKNKFIYVINLNKNKEIKLGRGREANVILSDISVSRYHCAFKVEKDGVYLQDKESKFGTQILIQTPFISMVENLSLHIQIGRTHLDIELKRPFSFFDCCTITEKPFYDEYYKQNSRFIEKKRVLTVKTDRSVTSSQKDSSVKFSENDIENQNKENKTDSINNKENDVKEDPNNNNCNHNEAFFKVIGRNENNNLEGITNENNKEEENKKCSNHNLHNRLTLSVDPDIIEINNNAQNKNNNNQNLITNIGGQVNN